MARIGQSRTREGRLNKLLLDADQQGLADRLNKARLMAGMTELDASSKSGVNRALVSEFERGQRSPNMDHLSRLAKSYQISLGWLANGDGPIYPEGLPRTVANGLARQLRSAEIDPIGAITAALRNCPVTSDSMAIMIGAVAAQYVSAHGLIRDHQELAEILDGFSTSLNLDLIRVLEETGTFGGLQAAQCLAQFLPYRGIDPDAFGFGDQVNGWSPRKRVEYLRSVQRPLNAVEAIAAERKFPLKPRGEVQGVVNSFVESLLQHPNFQGVFANGQ